jgi:hypothetical protein
LTYENVVFETGETYENPFVIVVIYGIYETEIFVIGETYEKPFVIFVICGIYENPFVIFDDEIYENPFVNDEKLYEIGIYESVVALGKLHAS